MKLLPEICIKRPIFAAVLSIILLLIGIICYFKLPLRWIPLVKPPIVSVRTTYAGANPQLIENQITTPIEDALVDVDNVDKILSKSTLGSSHVRVIFRPGTDLNIAEEDVQNAVSRVLDDLPENAKRPIISTFDTDSIPVLFVAFFDSHRDINQVSDYVEKFIKPVLNAIPGVGNVEEDGEHDYAMRIWLDPKKMAARHIAVNEVVNVLKTHNLELPAGQIKTPTRYYTVILRNRGKDADDYNNLVIRKDANGMIRLSDIGHAEVGINDPDYAFRVNGKPAVALGILLNSNANPLRVTTQVEKKLQQLEKTLPQGMHAEIVFSQAKFIRASVHSVYSSLLTALILVLIVIVIFLGNLRSALIPAVTIPICLLGACIFLYGFQYSINTITLLAVVLAVGLVVDDAIVVVENISRYIEMGIKPVEAAIKGSREIVFAIVGMTITLAAVYLPIAFQEGVTGIFFKQFALTLVGAVFVSGFIALTLSPMKCSLLLGRNAHNNKYHDWLEKVSHNFQNNYGRLLQKILQHKWWIFSALGILLAISGFLYSSLPKELSPMQDVGHINVFVTTPHDSSFKATDQLTKQIEKIYPTLPGVKSYFVETGGRGANSAHSFFVLKPWGERKYSANQIADMLRDKLQNITGAHINVSLPSPPLEWFSSGNGSRFVMSVVGAVDYVQLQQIVSQFEKALSQYKGLNEVTSGLKWDTESLQLNLDQDKLADLQISADDVNQTLYGALAKEKIGDFVYGGKLYDILVQLPEKDIQDPNLLNNLYVKNAVNQMIPVTAFTEAKFITMPSALRHYNSLRSDMIYANLTNGYSLGAVIQHVVKLAKQILPNDVSYKFLGAADTYLNESHTMLVAFLLALLFIYLILAALFESLIDPLVIMFGVPLAIFGGLLTLKLAGCSLNIYSNIGLITLIGLIAKHGILITDFANKKREQGMEVITAVVEAAKLRLRPILMTTAAMVLGALPLALASGAGAEVRHQIGWVIVGGLLFGTFFSLCVVPVMYVLLAGLKRK